VTVPAGTLAGQSFEVRCPAQGHVTPYHQILSDLCCLRNDDAETLTYFFLPRDELLKLPGDRMPVFQKLASEGKLKKVTMSVEQLLERIYLGEYACISHRWTNKHHPDPKAEQLREIQEYAKQHPELTYYWADYWSMPQEWFHESHMVKYVGQGRQVDTKKDEDGQYVKIEKNEIEKQYFKKTLESINFLYLGTEVLILLDKDYLHRFWCLLEAYLALHELDPKEGLRLKGTDIMVTNASDKDVMLKKMEVFQGEAQKRLKGRSVCKSRDGKAWWDVFGS